MSEIKRQIRMERDGNLLRINNKWYRFVVDESGDFRVGTHVLIEVDKPKIDKKIKLIATKLFRFINPELVLSDALKDLPEEELEKLYNYILKHKGKLRPTVSKHCIQMRIGDVDIPIRG